MNSKVKSAKSDGRLKGDPVALAGSTETAPLPTMTATNTTAEMVVDEENLAKEERAVDDTVAAEPPLDEKKKTGDGCLSWAMIVVAVAFLISVSAQEFTVEQYYDTFLNFARLENKTELNSILAWVKDWAIPPYLASIEIVFVILPILWVLETKGTRVTVISLSVFALVGVTMKMTADLLDIHYLVIYAGQIVINVSRIGMLPVIHRMAIAWFGNRCISLVCAVVFFSDHLGMLIGYLVPHLSYWALNHDTEAFISTMKVMYPFMALAPIVFGAILSLMIKDEPIKAPSPGEKLRRQRERPEPSFRAFLQRTGNLFKDDFNLVLLAFGFGLAFGITMMVFHPIRLTVLFEIQEGQLQDLDLPITTASIFAGYLGAVLSGMLLDKTRQHQGIASAAYLFVFIFNIILSVSIHVKATNTIFFAYGALSFFFSAYLVSALEYAAEKSYPAYESTTTGLLMSAGYVVAGLFSVFTGTHYLSIQDATLTGYIASALLSIGLLCTAGLEPSYLKRYSAGDAGIY